jgi:hypothetical protein
LDSVVAVVIGAAGACVNWESVRETGFAYANLQGKTVSAEVKCFDDRSDARSFDLDIPAGLLEANALYKFRIVANSGYDDVGMGRAIAQMRTLPIPRRGACSVRLAQAVKLGHVETCGHAKSTLACRRKFDKRYPKLSSRIARVRAFRYGPRAGLHSIPPSRSTAVALTRAVKRT